MASLIKTIKTRFNQRVIWPLFAGLVITGLMFNFTIINGKSWQFWQSFEARTYDARINATLLGKTDSRVVIADIDEQSLATEGQFPWPRNRLAKLVENLHNAGAKVIAFDIVFAEPEDAPDKKLLDQLYASGLGNNPQFTRIAEPLRSQLDRDTLFGASLSGKNVVMGYFFNNDGSSKPVGTLPADSIPEKALKNKGLFIPEATSYGANLAILQQNAASGGFFSTSPDADGVLRKVPLLYRYGDQIYGSLALQALRLYVGHPDIEIVTEDFGRGQVAIDYIRLGDLTLPTDSIGQVLVPYFGPQKSFKYLSADDILQGRLEPESLKDKIVLVGTSAMGLLDLRSTPVDPAYPGVEIHASIIAGALNNAFRAESLEKLGMDATVLLFFGLLASVLLPLLTPALSLIFSGISLALIILINWYAWVNGLVLALAAPLATVLILLAGNMAYGFLFESRGRRHLKEMFGQYVPPELVQEMSENPEKFNLDGESRLMTVLFADIRSFTTISESLNPRELKDLLNRYFTPMTEIIHHNRGTIDKYVGDMIMSFWGAPLNDPDHANHAVSAALQMLQKAQELNPELQKLGYPEIKMGIGLNTGPMNVGNMGSEFRMAYTVLGDSVNLGSRLEGLTKVYGVNLMVSDSTARSADDYIYRELDRVVVKGQSKPVTIYEPLCHKEQLTQELKDELGLAKRALKLFHAQDWDNAEMQFISLMQAHPDVYIYPLYVKERIPFFRQNPPPEGWQGEFWHTSK